MNEVEARQALAKALVLTPQKWEPETALRNLRLIREAGKRRGAALARVREIVEALTGRPG